MFLCCQHKNTNVNSEEGNLITTIKYSIIKTFPHDVSSFTEGLQYSNGLLYESTGSPDNYPKTKSVFGIVDLSTGFIDVKAELDKTKYFGEGITILNDKIYQVTYKSQVGFVYDNNTFERIGSFKYDNTEGWGLTTDGVYIIMSDGTQSLTFFDPKDLRSVKTIDVTFNGAPVLFINELEYIKGFIYANIWTTNNIVKINPVSGEIIGIIDLTPLFMEARKEYHLAESTNGIAYDYLTDMVFVTGKFWPKIYQIELSD